MPSVRLRTTVEVSEQTDFFNPRVKEAFTETSTPDEALSFEVQADTAGTVVELGTFDTGTNVDGITDIIIYNEDATNFCLALIAVQRGVAQTYAANELTFVEGGAALDTITKGVPGTPFNNVAMDINTGDYVRVAGATAAGDNGIFLVATSPSATVITLADDIAGGGLDAAAGITIQSLARCLVRIDPGTCVKLQRIHPAGDLTLEANTAPVNCRVVLFGT